MSRSVLLAAGMALALSGAACGTHMQAVAGEQGIADLACPAELTRVWFRAHGDYLVRGCGRSAAYRCEERDEGPTCTIDGDIGPWKPRQRPLQPLQLDSTLEMVFADMAPRILRCLKYPREVRVPAFILEPGEGDFSDTDLATEEQQCIRQVVADTPLPQALRPYDWRTAPLGSDRSLAQVLADAQFTIATTAAVPTASAPASSAAPPASAPVSSAAPSEHATPQIEEQLRASIKKQRQAILLCVDKPMAVVRSSYSPSGEVQATLQGVESGSPEERCVQDVLKDLRVDPSPSGGHVLQVVRRDEGE